jgi:hypothetical protein
MSNERLYRTDLLEAEIAPEVLAALLDIREPAEPYDWE